MDRLWEIHYPEGQVVNEPSLVFQVVSKEAEIVTIEATYAYGEIPEPGDITVLGKTVEKIRNVRVSDQDQNVEIR